MSYPIPHFRDKDDLTTEMRAVLAEAALENLRRLSGRPEQGALLETVVVQPPIFTLPTLRDRDKAPILPAFDPAWTPATCGAPGGFVPTPKGLLKAS